MYRHLEYDEVSAHVVRVRLNRPAAANALSGALLAELDDAVARIAEDEEVRAWLLTGSPRPDGRPCFGAGADLKEALDPKAGAYPEQRRWSLRSRTCRGAAYAPRWSTSPSRRGALARRPSPWPSGRLP